MAGGKWRRELGSKNSRSEIRLTATVGYHLHRENMQTKDMLKREEGVVDRRRDSIGFVWGTVGASEHVRPGVQFHGKPPKMFSERRKRVL